MSALADALNKLREMEESIKPRIKELEKKEAEEDEKEAIRIMGYFRDTLSNDPRATSVKISIVSANARVAALLRKIMSAVYPKIEVSAITPFNKPEDVYYGFTKFRE